MQRRDQEDQRQRLFQRAGADLTTIDGRGVETAEVILSEYGVHVNKFATEREFVSHLKLVPRRPVSGGKVLKRRPPRHKGTLHGRSITQRGYCTAPRSERALGAYYRRLARRKDSSIAVFATARKLGTLVYRMLRWGQQYTDIGQEAYERLYEAVRLRSVTTTAAQPGYRLIREEPAFA